MKSSRPFHVSTFGLSPDLKRIDPLFGNINRGDVSRQALRIALEAYRQIETQWGPSVSRIVIKSEMGTFIVHAGGKQLTLATKDPDPAAPQGVPVTTAEIMGRLEQAPVDTAVAPRPTPESPSRSAATLGLICVGVVLIVQAVKPLFSPEKPRPGADVTLVTTLAELKTRRQAVAGIYATGQKLGDRHLMVSPDGHIVFSELGPRQSIAAGADSYRLGQRGQQTCLVTPRSGVIEAVDANTLVYYGDTYRRIK